MKDLHEIKAMVFLILLIAIFVAFHFFFSYYCLCHIRFSVETIGTLGHSMCSGSRYARVAELSSCDVIKSGKPLSPYTRSMTGQLRSSPECNPFRLCTKCQ